MEAPPKPPKLKGLGKRAAAFAIEAFAKEMEAYEIRSAAAAGEGSQTLGLGGSLENTRPANLTAANSLSFRTATTQRVLTGKRGQKDAEKPLGRESERTSLSQMKTTSTSAMRQKLASGLKVDLRLAMENMMAQPRGSVDSPLKREAQRTSMTQMEGAAQRKMKESVQRLMQRKMSATQMAGKLGGPTSPAAQLTAMRP